MAMTKNGGRLVSRRKLLGLLAAASVSQPVLAGLPDTVAAMKESVVLVGTFSALDNPRFGFRGTGFVVSNGNLVVTNAHVLPEPGSPDSLNKQVAVQVWSRPNEWALRLAKVISIDRPHDLALLSFEGSAAPAVKLASALPREGDSIALMGFPIGGALGYSHVTHHGIISSVAPIGLPSRTAQQLNERVLQQLRAGNFEILQLDATAYPGNSGGPIFDPETGVVVGVINSGLVKGSREAALTHPSGISYGIPVRHVHDLLRP